MTGPVLVTGAGGLLGREVVEALRANGLEAVPLDHAALDVADEAKVRPALAAAHPAAVVHCAAMTDVDACESDPERAHAVNALGSLHVAAAAAEAGAEVVAVSTDYVFDGTKGAPYAEDDRPHPIQAYGRSKLAGERHVAHANPRHYVLRSAWIYGRGGKSFLSRLFDVAARGRITAVADQTGSPTYAPELARSIVAVLGSGAYGLYHATNEGACSFAEFCRYALEAAAVTCQIEEVSWRDLGRAAARPENTSLACPRWIAAGFEPLRPWREAAKDFVEAAR